MWQFKLWKVHRYSQSLSKESLSSNITFFNQVTSEQWKKKTSEPASKNGSINFGARWGWRLSEPDQGYRSRFHLHLMVTCFIHLSSTCFERFKESFGQCLCSPTWLRTLMFYDIFRFIEAIQNWPEGNSYLSLPCQLLMW